MSQRLERLTQWIEEGIDDPFAWYARAMELKSLGRQQEAAEAFATVRQRYPNYLATYLMAGQLAATMGLPQEAKQWFDAGLSLAQQTGDAHTASELQAALQALPDNRDSTKDDA